MKILVTGCCGFIGSHLCERLLKEDYSILGSEEEDEDLDIFDEEIINEMKRKEEEKQNKIKELKKEINNFENEIKNKKNILTELLNK